MLTAAGNAAKAYGLQIAQAAAQAFAWVSGGSGTFPTSGFSLAPSDLHSGNPVYDIALALSTVVSNPNPTSTLTLMQQLETRPYFGIVQANHGTIGAGALGLNAKGLTDDTLVVAPSGNAKGDFYQHYSATGTPVTNIFNL
ncbi:MAG: hypothetical protein WDN28_21055 [Chthoniobacter sp.]